MDCDDVIPTLVRFRIAAILVVMATPFLWKAAVLVAACWLRVAGKQKEKEEKEKEKEKGKEKESGKRML